MKDVTYYINAGGLGTRLESEVQKDQNLGIAKALLSFGASPAVRYQIERGLNNGFQVLVAAGHHTKVADYVLQEFSTNVEVITHPYQYGTGGDLCAAITDGFIKTKYICIVNVDTILDVDEAQVLKYHITHGQPVTIVLSRRLGVPNQDAYWCNEYDQVIYCDEAIEVYKLKKPQTGNWTGSSTGMVFINTDVLQKYINNHGLKQLSLYRELLGLWTSQGLVQAYDNGKKFFMDFGTPKNYKKLQTYGERLKIVLEQKLQRQLNQKRQF